PRTERNAGNTIASGLGIRRAGGARRCAGALTPTGPLHSAPHSVESVASRPPPRISAQGFFRRSIQKQIEYRCLRDGKCLVIRLNRNRCQYCRFKKCLAVGMSRDSVRYGRVPKRVREPREEAVAAPASSTSLSSVSSASSMSSGMEAQPEAVREGVAREIAVDVVAAHRAHNSYTDELKCTLARHDVVVQPEGDVDRANEGEEAASSSTDAPKTKSLLWAAMAVRMTPAIQQVVEFAKKLPGFYLLPQDDQLILIKLGFFEVWVTRAARFASANQLVFDDGSVFYQYQLETAYGDAGLAAAQIAYMRTVNNLQLTEDEVGLLCGALLLSPSRVGLTDMQRMDMLHDIMLDALKYCLSAGGTTSTTPDRMEAVLAAIAEARQLSARFHQALDWCRDHWQLLALPPLFAEIFDITKNAEPAEEPKPPAPATRMQPVYSGCE
ncbi:hypothetical protein JYU34_000484, partial [Plutella xylostella]